MDGATGSVLDASALLTYLHDEPGSEVVEAALAGGAVINVATYAEALTRMSDTGADPVTVHRRFQENGFIGDLLRVVPLIEADAVTIARLGAITRSFGLALGDRACLATALRLGRPVYTADRSWAGLNVGVTVHLIRP
jgi:PIN domain nuclease of toxin-antitoxin system